MGVWNLNIQNQTSDQSRRIFNVAKEVAAIDSQRGRASDLFAFQEAHYTKDYSWLPPWGVKFKPRKVLCYENDQGAQSDGFTDRLWRLMVEGEWSSECFFDTWKRHLSPTFAPTVGNAVHHQYGDCSVLGNDQFMTVIPVPFQERSLGQLLSNSDYFFGNIGNSEFGRLQRVIVGGRFQLHGSSDVLPFYSTHLEPDGEQFSSTRIRQVFQSKDVVSFVLNNFKEGDVTPLVVGDFNFSSASNPDAYDVMNDSFWEVGHSLGGSGVEHFWVGRETSFPTNGGVLRLVPESYDLNAFLNDEAVDFTDHVCPYVELEIPHPNK